MSIDAITLVESLQRPEAYPWRPENVDLVETHISWVFLAGDRVVKVKRPVQFPFVDHRSAAQRRHSCEEEARLNRRLTMDVYLGVVPIRRSGAELAVDGEGEPVEWATLMRRLPHDRMLDVLLAANEAPHDLADRLAAVLIPFHRETAGRCDATEPELTAVITDNLDELRPFAGPLLGATQFALLDEAMRGFIGDHGDLLAKRVAEGWIRDGHGDLRAEHVCLEPDGVQIFDCVEFNSALRCADVASDLAFLVMDLDRLGTGSAAQELVAHYRAAGIDLPDPLLRWYRAHRALVRAKVACIETGGDATTHPELTQVASTYLDLATAAMLSFQPFLIAMTGLSGTGKSTVAASLARATGAELLASDVVRKHVAGVSGPSPADWGEGLYDEAWTERTYDALFSRAAEALRAGRTVILDASFLDGDRREQAAAVAAHAGVPFLLVGTICDPAIAEARIKARAARGASASDATTAVFRRQQREALRRVPPVPDGAIHIQIDTGLPNVQATNLVLAALNSNRSRVPCLMTR